ncbi:TRAP transporter permease [Petroclostridium sp. X23]|uniref:TRAP transporter permease n=1 Tax=Petroclostridium sp. X23 TaxID=3045146 RepID=UPI0024AE7BA1|nr:TRAP transporter permease [Petroclostridium sp. X23]WHH58214.1 TRAP transporter permease [Petroclostridium sp. X23]
MKKKDDIDIQELENEGLPKRELVGGWSKVIFIVGVFMSLFHIYSLAIHPINPWVLYSAHIGFGFILTLALYCGTKRATKIAIPIYDLILMVLSIFSVLYMITQRDTIIHRIGVSPTPLDLVVSIIIVVLVLEITRRTCGNILPFIAVVFIFYAHFGKYLPGILGHRGYSWSKILSYLIGMDAIFSTPIGASANMVFLFIVFGAFLGASGSGKFFIDLALSVSGSQRGGPAKVAILSSALFGSVSGNSVANVASTGSFTIPMMKSIGYRPAFAGAVEACASTGGQIMPPILGSAAFIMAQLIGEPYTKIVLASIIPAFLYFYTVYLMVDLEAIKYNLKGMPKENLPSFKYVATHQGYLILPLLVLIISLSVLNMTPIRSSIYAIITAIAVTYIRKETRMGIKGILTALAQGAYSSVGIISACATAGIVVGVLNMTGAGLKFASAVISLSMGILPLALFLTMLASIVLGMGLPTTASYLICAAVTAPALVQMGLSPLAAHMFVFYFACISAITPPVALAAFAGAGIAKAKPIDVAFTACKIGISAFIIPFMFAYGPSLLWGTSLNRILSSAISATIGVTMLSFGLQKRAFKIELNTIGSVIITASSLLLIKPGIMTDTIGVIACSLVIIVTLLREKVKKEAKETA